MTAYRATQRVPAKGRNPPRADPRRGYQPLDFIHVLDLKLVLRPESDPLRPLRRASRIVAAVKNVLPVRADRPGTG